MKLVKLVDAFEPMSSESVLFDLFPQPPWEVLAPEYLNFEYFFNHSGKKFCSPLVLKFLDDNDKLTVEAKTIIVYTLTQKYYLKWNRLWDTITKEYNFLHNYNMTETTLRSQNTTDNTATTKYGVDTRTDDIDITRSSDETDYAFGYNSESTDRNPSGKFVSTGDETNDSTISRNFSNTENDNRTVNDAETVTVNRSGNIGVTTSQKMIAEERELWVWNYFEQVYADVDEVLSLAVYDMCQI